MCVCTGICFILFLSIYTQNNLWHFKFKDRPESSNKNPELWGTMQLLYLKRVNYYEFKTYQKLTSYLVKKHQ